MKKSPAISNDLFKIYGEVPRHKYLLHRMEYAVGVEMNIKGIYSNEKYFIEDLEYLDKNEMPMKFVKESEGTEGIFKLFISGKGVMPSEIRSVLNDVCHISKIEMRHMEIKSFPMMDERNLKEYVGKVKNTKGFETVEPPAYECMNNKEFLLYGKYENMIYKLYKIFGFGSRICNYEMVYDGSVVCSSDADLIKAVSGIVDVMEKMGYEGCREISEMVFEGGSEPDGRMIGGMVHRERKRAGEIRRKAEDMMKSEGSIGYLELLKMFDYAGKKYGDSKMVSKFIKDMGYVKKIDVASGEKRVCIPS